MRIGIIGGTGKEGRGMALRWARAGHEVCIGSRDAARARTTAAELAEKLADGAGTLCGGDNAEAVGHGEVVLLSVPYGAHAGTLTTLKDALQGKILLDITVPLRPPKVRQVHLPPGSAAALEGQALLGAGVHVVAALHHVSSAHLADPDHAVDCDVLACGDDPAALERSLQLIADLGLRGIDAGPLANAVALESLTPVLLYINRRYKGTGAGIRISGLP